MANPCLADRIHKKYRSFHKSARQHADATAHHYPPIPPLLPSPPHPHSGGSQLDYVASCPDALAASGSGQVLSESWIPLHLSFFTSCHFQRWSASVCVRGALQPLWPAGLSAQIDPAPFKVPAVQDAWVVGVGSDELGGRSIGTWMLLLFSSFLNLLLHLCCSSSVG